MLDDFRLDAAVFEKVRGNVEVLLVFRGFLALFDVAGKFFEEFLGLIMRLTRPTVLSCKSFNFPFKYTNITSGMANRSSGISNVASDGLNSRIDFRNVSKSSNNGILLFSEFVESCFKFTDFLVAIFHHPVFPIFGN